MEEFPFSSARNVWERYSWMWWALGIASNQGRAEVPVLTSNSSITGLATSTQVVVWVSWPTPAVLETHLRWDSWDGPTSDLRVAGLLQLCPCLKYWGFSTTGMRVIPMTTASGPASRVHGVMIPWLTWWRGLAESSSPLMTATGPGRTHRDNYSLKLFGCLILAVLVCYFKYETVQAEGLQICLRGNVS